MPPVSVMPTLITLGNLVAGFSAIHYASKPDNFVGPWGWSGLTFAACLVFLGMMLDSVDGWVARLTRTTSALGGQLDSLADVVTFGVAPAYKMLQLVRHHVVDDTGAWIIGPEADDVLGKAIWAIAVVYVCCAALRLARYNVETGLGTIDHGSKFRGLPSPGAAGAVASLILLHQHLLVGRLGDEVPAALARGTALGLPFVALLCAFAMVSTVPYVHVANRYIYGARSYPYVVRLVVTVALLIWIPPYALAVLFTAYALSGPGQMVIRRFRGQRTGDEQSESDDEDTHQAAS